MAIHELSEMGGDWRADVSLTDSLTEQNDDVQYMLSVFGVIGNLASGFHMDHYMTGSERSISRARS
jgi:hypothetical protein